MVVKTVGGGVVLLVGAYLFFVSGKDLIAPADVPPPLQMVTAAAPALVFALLGLEVIP